MPFSLPDGLPPGRFLPCGSTLLWVSDVFPQGVEEMWPRLLSGRTAHGLVPLLCGPDAMGWPLSPAHTDASRLEEAASRLPAGFVETDRFGLDECRLVLVPALRGSDALASIGWSAKAPLPLLHVLLRSWEDRFGAQVVAAFGSELHVSVARPPVEAEHAALLALEHVLSTANNIVDDPPTPFPEYATEPRGRTSWSFWWDQEPVRPIIRPVPVRPITIRRTGPEARPVDCLPHVHPAGA